MYLLKVQGLSDFIDSKNHSLEPTYKPTILKALM